MIRLRIIGNRWILFRMIQLIKTALKQFIDDIDSGNSYISENQQQELLSLLLQFNQKELSKVEAAEYIGVSRATFDNYIKKGLIPEGKKYQGRSNLLWRKSDLDKYLNEK